MRKNLVAYFSVSGVTRRAARLVAEAAEADLFEIAPEVPYTAADLDWTDKCSRSTVEMQDPDCRPALCGDAPDTTGYDTVYVGFPVWWGREPSVVDTFLDLAQLKGKTVVPFCTSGGSGVEGAAARMAELLSGKAEVTCGKRISADASEEDIRSWMSGM